MDYPHIMLIAEVNTIIEKDNSISWTGRLYECSLQEVAEYDENDNAILVERMVHDSLVDTHEFASDNHDADIQQLTEDYYGI